MSSTIVSYTKDKSTVHKDLSIADAAKIKDSKVWIDISKPTLADMEELKKAYGFHQLALDDCMHDVQRPKIDVYEGHFFVVARHIVIEAKEMKSKQIGIFVAKDHVVTIRKDNFIFLEEIRKSILEGGHRISKLGTDYLLYKILDKIVDNYFIILDSIEEEIDAIENKVLEKPDKKSLREVFRIKRQLLLVIKPIWPLREVLHLLQSGSIESVTNQTLPYFRDIYDHLINIIDLIETYRELVTASLESYLSMISNMLNEVVKALTALASLFMIPMLIASIYGMNFKYMPEINWSYGYPFVLLLMFVSVAFTFLYFKRKGWY